MKNQDEARAESAEGEKITFKGLADLGVDLVHGDLSPLRYNANKYASYSDEEIYDKESAANRKRGLPDIRPDDRSRPELYE